MAQRNLVKTASGRLKDEFAGIFAAETIERFIADSLDQLLGTAKVTTFVPIFVERFTRDRLRALAKVEGKIDDRRAVGAVPVRPQRRSIPDGGGVAEAPGR